MKKLNKEQLKRLVKLCVIFLLVCLLEIMYYFSVVFAEGSFQCRTLKWFHLQCPGCGGTRMVIALLHGQLYQAFRWNNFLFVSLPIAIVFTLWQIWYYVICGKVSKAFTIFLEIFVCLLLLFGILRNFDAFSFMLPTKIN